MSTRILRKNEIYFDFSGVKKQVSQFELTREDLLLLLEDLKVTLAECEAIELQVMGAFVKFTSKELFTELLNKPIFFKLPSLESYRIDARHEIIVRVEGLPLKVPWRKVTETLSRFGTIYTVEFEFAERKSEGEKLKKTGIRLLHMELRKPIPLCSIIIDGLECFVLYPGQTQGLLSVPPVQREWFVVEGWQTNTEAATIRSQCIKKLGTSDVRVEPLFKDKTRPQRKCLAFKVSVRVAYLEQAMQPYMWPDLKVRMFVEKPVKKEENTPPAAVPKPTLREPSPEEYVYFSGRIEVLPF